MSVLPWWTNADVPIVPGHGLGRRLTYGQPFPRMTAPAHAMTFTVNRRLDLPRHMLPNYDQGSEGACAGFAWSWAMSILNRRFYAARKLYLEAQFIDPWSDTPPEEGTSTMAPALILRDQGHWRFVRGMTWPIALNEGVRSFVFARTVDDLRLSILNGIPAVLGVNWYDSFDAPVWGDFGKGGNRWWIGRNWGLLGDIRGGHCICCFGARDDIQAFTLVNSWGVNYPIVNIPYLTVERLLKEDGDLMMPVDRP